MKCIDCCFYWRGLDDDFAHCQFIPRCADDCPPCEYDDYDEPDDYRGDEYITPDED